VLVMFSTLLISAAQILYKIGSRDLSLDLSALVRNWPLFLGFSLYVVSAFLVTMAFKRGELSVLFPIIALSYVWVCLLAQAFLHEQMNSWKWLGIAAIIGGVTSIGFGSKSSEGRDEVEETQAPQP